MTIQQLGTTESERYVFVPEMPTPNGPLHLGHMSGPYLRSDILARFLRRKGHEAFLVSGSDSYESHVELKAAQTGQSISDVCNGFHRRIKGELDALGIQTDLYVNPLDPEIGPSYLAFNRDVVDQLRAVGAATRATERVLFSAENNGYVAGCWMSGECPSCGAKSGSYLCEACGTQYDPQDVKNVRVPAGWSDAREVSVEFWFLDIRTPANLWRQIAKMGIEPDFVRIVERYFDERGHRVRLTNPGNWGMRYGADNQVIFTYTALFSFSVFCGRLLAERKGWDKHPFALDGSCKTVAGFGIDNAIPYLVGVLGSALELGNVRLFDHYLTNHFYQLEGLKFSTSRQHLVCASQLVNAGVNVDALRYYLAKVNPEKGKRSFSPADFVHCHNDYLHQDLGKRIEGAQLEAAGGGGEIGSLPTTIAERLHELLRVQDSQLSFPNPNLECAVGTLDTWSALGAALRVGMTHNPGTVEATRAYWWLKGFALLAAPFMPSVSERLATLLGNRGPATLKDFSLSTRPTSPPEPWTPFGLADMDRVDACISREGAGR
jgi:methionyl-tRNA synthetase